MTSFFSALGGKLAEKWLSLLVLPGLQLASTAAVAFALGHSHALDWNELARRVDGWSAAVGGRPPVVQILLLVVVLLAAAGAGLVIRALSGLTQRLWLGTWPSWSSPVDNKLVANRVENWNDAHRKAKAATGRRADLLAAERNRIAMAKPTRPTWMGDRVAAADERVHNQYGADLRSWWPRLWLILDDATRAELRAARAAFDTATNQATWAVGYLMVGLFWWPAALIALGVGLTGWLRGRDAAHTYADMIESTVDVYAAALAVRLGVLEESENLTPEVGEKVTELLRKGT